MICTRGISLLLVMAGLLRSQVPAAPEEISFDLVARDKKGKPIQNLKAADLRVFDNGKEVALTGLDLVSDSADSPRSLTFVVDHMEATGTSNARRVAERVLKMTPNGNIQFAVFRIDGRLKLYQKATSNRDLVRKAIHSLDQARSDSPEVEKALALEAKTGTDAAGQHLSVNERQQDKALISALGQAQHMVRDLRMQSALGSLLMLVQAAQSQPGRKAILFLTGGLKMDLNSRELMRTLIGTANKAGVSIYAVDVNSLDGGAVQSMVAGAAMQQVNMSGQNSVAPATTNGPVIPADTSVGAGTGSVSQENMGRMESGLGSGQFSLADLCSGTAGRFLGNGEDLKYQLRRLFADLSSYYRASYVLPGLEPDGQFRRLQVKPVLKNVRVLAGSGYLALPLSSPVGSKPFEVILQRALSQSHLRKELGFSSAVIQMGELAETSEMTSALVVDVPFRDFQGNEDRNTGIYSMHFSLLAQIKDQAGTIIENFSEDIFRRGGIDNKDQMRAEMATVTRHFNAQAGDYVLEVAVQDRNGDKVSAQRQPFKIQNAPASAYLSDVSLVRRMEALHTEPDASEPLQYHGNRIVPDISGQVGAQAKEVAFFFIVHPEPKSTSKPKLEMEIRKDKQAVGRGELHLLESGDGKPVSYLANLKAASFGAGTYEAAVILTQDGKTTERSTTFTVTGPELASAGGSVIPALTNHAGLTIASATGDLPKPSGEELNSLLAAARQRARDYTDLLPNVMCREVTDRSIDSLGTGAFQHRDTITELIRYHDKNEQRLTLGVNNRGIDWDRSALKGTLTSGEFGGLLNSIFATEADAQFEWKETDVLGGDSVQVFAYKVDQVNSTLVVQADNGQMIKPGFHGLVYVDESTRAIRRLTLESNEMPEEFPTHSVTFVVDYDYIAIGEHEYLLPVSGSARIVKGKRSVLLNEFEFSDYKRYSAESNVQFDH